MEPMLLAFIIKQLQKKIASRGQSPQSGGAPQMLQRHMPPEQLQQQTKALQRQKKLLDFLQIYQDQKRTQRPPLDMFNRIEMQPYQRRQGGPSPLAILLSLFGGRGG